MNTLELKINKNKKTVIGAGILFIIIVCVMLMGKHNNTNNILNFEAKFLACLEYDTDIMYDSINGVISKSDKVNKYKNLLTKYEEIQKECPSELKNEYNNYLESKSKLIRNYATYTVKDRELNENDTSKLIEKMNDLNAKYKIDIDKRNAKAKEYYKAMQR